ncbi:hypothetical protein OG589_10915 [Sphaerisporangium sp. NBC_01403]|uniref:molybdopterin dinucleotide binding domain-containing protein n=1 Tax=Sphaerisporangium sp. NBC_01403 TaxID=2903599 RepID=UPI00324ECEF1
MGEGRARTEGRGDCARGGVSCSGGGSSKQTAPGSWPARASASRRSSVRWPCSPPTPGVLAPRARWPRAGEIRHGRAELVTRLSEDTVPGQAFCAFHFPSSGVNTLTSSHADTVMACPEYKVTAVRVRRCPGAEVV